MLVNRPTPFKIWINFQHFILCIAMLENIFANSFHVKLFAGVTSGTFLCFSLHLFFPFMSPFTKFLFLTLLALVGIISSSTIALIIAFMSDYNFQHFYLCFFLLYFYLYWPVFSFDYSFFAKCHLSLSPGNRHGPSTYLTVWVGTELQMLSDWPLGQRGVRFAF